MEKKGSYVGSIGNSGVQVVKAPISNGKHGNGSVKTGGDLRTK